MLRSIAGFLGISLAMAQAEISKNSKVVFAIEKADNRIKKGLKKFDIAGKQVWAINEKNAIRKANKQAK